MELPLPYLVEWDLSDRQNQQVEKLIEKDVLLIHLTSYILHI